MSHALVRFLYPIVWFVFSLVHPRRTYGLEKVPQGGALFCANHTRASDPFFIIFALRRRNFPHVMAKAEIMRLPLLGPLLRKVGVFGVDRGKSDVGAIKEAIRILKSDEKLLLFPQGTRVKEGDAQAAKTGAAMLALRTGVPIVPIWLPAKKKWFGRTDVVIGDPYYPPQPAGRHATSEEYRAVADDLMGRIDALSEVPHGTAAR